MEITGTLVNWYAEDVGLGAVRLSGNIFNDSKGRFSDGEFIHTSIFATDRNPKTYKKGDVVNTRFSAYRLGAPRAMSKQITKTVYLMKRISSGDESCSIWNWADGDSPDYILLAKQEVVFNVEVTDAEIVAAQVAGLEKEITKVRLESHARVTALQDCIQSLLSITHQPEEV